MLGQRFDCISHEPVYLSRMLSLKESVFPRHADYVGEFRNCVIKSKVKTSDLQMGYLVNSRFVEGLSNDAVRRQYIVEFRSRWHSSRPFGVDTLVQMKPVRTPVAIFGSLGVCIYVPSSRHWLISYSPIHLT